MRNRLFDEWNFSKNSGLLHELPVSHKVWWICEQGHEWEETIFNRLKSNVNCPYCSGRRACRDNCLATKAPEIAKQWHPKKNASLTPNDVVVGTHKKVWWICEQGHEWEASVVKRTRQHRNCPYCSNQKVCRDNCLATKAPEIAKQWHPKKNAGLTPNDVVFGSCKKVWWICECGYSWKTTPAKRVVQGTGCPICKSSKGEKIIAQFLQHEEIDYIAQHKFVECKNRKLLPFDFYLPNYNLCIEFQGEQHFHPVPYFGGVQKFLKVNKRDKIKIDFCLKQGINLLLIPYWELGCIRRILKKEIYNV